MLIASGLAVVLAGCAGQAQSTTEQTSLASSAPAVPVQPASTAPAVPQSEVPAQAQSQPPATSQPEAGASVQPQVDDEAVQPEPAVPLCAYYTPSGQTVSAPCDPALLDPSQQLVPVEQSAPPQETVEAITCDTVCTSSGCEQYQYSVLNCPPRG